MPVPLRQTKERRHWRHDGMSEIVNHRLPLLLRLPCELTCRRGGETLQENFHRPTPSTCLAVLRPSLDPGHHSHQKPALSALKLAWNGGAADH